MTFDFFTFSPPSCLTPTAGRVLGYCGVISLYTSRPSLVVLVIVVLVVLVIAIVIVLVLTGAYCGVISL